MRTMSRLSTRTWSSCLIPPFPAMIWKDTGLAAIWQVLMLEHALVVGEETRALRAS